MNQGGVEEDQPCWLGAAEEKRQLGAGEDDVLAAMSAISAPARARQSTEVEM